jgi:enterochelin esterase family protein
MMVMHDLVKRAKADGTPLVESEAATFVWRGRKPPKLIGDFNRWDPAQAVALEAAGPGVWAATVNFRRDAYMEYVYLFGDKSTLDPLNARQMSNGLGQTNNYFYMPEGGPSPLLQPGRGPRGRVTRQVILSRGHDLKGEFVGKRRVVYLYQPPVDEPCPLVVVYDGCDYLRLGRLPRIVDNLIAQNRIRPVALAMVAHGGPAWRGVEYACNEATTGFIVNQVLPLAHAELNLVDPQPMLGMPGAFAVMGASMGGLMALYTALRHPELFGLVLSQSGAFGLDETEMVVFDLVRDGGPKPLKIWLDVGVYDFPELIPPHRRMGALLEAKGYPVTYNEYAGGHNYTSWRNEAGRGLEALFRSAARNGRTAKGRAERA